MTSWGTMQPGPRLRTRGDVARRPTEFVRNLRDLCPLTSAAHPNRRTFVDAETQTDVEITGEVSPIFVVRAAHAEIQRRVELGGDGSTQLELDALARAWDRRLRASRRARRTRRRGTRMAPGFGPPQGRVTAPQRRCSSSTWRAIRMQPRGANLTTSSWCPRAPLRLRRGSIDPARKVHLYRRLRSHPSRGGRACDPRRSAA